MITKISDFRDIVRILRILAACRTWSGNVVRTRSVLTASGKSSISLTDERCMASFEPRSSVALLPVVSSRGAAARVAGAAGNQFRGGYAATPAGRGTAGPPRSSAHGADCLREPQAPSLRASPGERRSPELAAQGAANVRGRRVGGRFHRLPYNVVVRKALRAFRDMRGTHRVPRTMRTGGSAAREQMTRELRSLEPRRSRHAAPRPFSPPGVS